MKKRSRFVGLVLMLIGALVLLNYRSKPGMNGVHGYIVCGLVASGMWLGIGLVALMGRLELWSSDSSRENHSTPVNK